MVAFSKLDIAVKSDPPFMNVSSISTASSLEYIVKFDNPTDETINGKIYIKRNALCQRSPVQSFRIEPCSEDTSVTLKVQFLPGIKRIEDVPDAYGLDIKFKIEAQDDDDTTHELDQTLSMSMETFIMGLKHQIPEPPKGAEKLNILIFGTAGTGKSAFIQTLYTAASFQSHVRTGDVKVGGSDKHCTGVIRRHEFDKGTPLENVAVWDTFGLANDTYVSGEMIHIAKGNLPDGFGIQDQIGVTISPKEMREAIRTSEARRPTAVLLFLPNGIEEDEDEIRGLKTNLGHLSDLGIIPIVVIGMVDKTWQEIRQHAMQPPEDLQTKKRAIADLLGIPFNQVTYSVPYESEVERNFQIDQLMYQTMDRVFRKSAQFINSSDFNRATKSGNERHEYYKNECKNEKKVEVEVQPTTESRSNTDTNFSICCMCFTNPTEILFKPCNHANVCQACSILVHKCGFCRESIDTKERIYIN